MQTLIDNSVNLGGKQTITGEKIFSSPITSDNSNVFLFKNIVFGEVTTGSKTGNQTVTFSKPFESSVGAVVASYVGTGTTNANTPPLIVKSWTTTSVTIYSGATQAQSMSYIAIGE